MPEFGIPTIPQFITVHDAAPSAPGENYTLTFPDYIKNVASSEIYPTWPDAALRANILAQISIALNRVYTEWYRSMGYDFDITSSTAFDQKFIPDREIYDSVSRIVDEIFNSYVSRPGDLAPLFTTYCDGVQVPDCGGLEQVGTVSLANQGLSPLEILRFYYGDDIEIVENAPVALPTPSYPGSPLRIGDIGRQVQLLQLRLNRISRNYPLIPKIPNTDGVFGTDTENAVRTFQQVFNLTPDGIVGNATWYRVAYIYASVKRLAELSSEGLSLSETPQKYPGVLRRGSSGGGVRVLQYYLTTVADYYTTIQPISIDGSFGPATENAVRSFQQTFGLPVDGIVGEQTWNALFDAYLGIVDTVGTDAEAVPLYPGYALAIGSRGEYVRAVQIFLNTVAEIFDDVPAVTVDGVFGPATERSVRAFQRSVGLPDNGVVNALTWRELASLYSDITDGSERMPGQFPGGTLPG